MSDHLASTHSNISSALLNRLPCAVRASQLCQHAEYQLKAVLCRHLHKYSDFNI